MSEGDKFKPYHGAAGGLGFAGPHPHQGTAAKGKVFLKDFISFNAVLFKKEGAMGN